MGVEVEGHIASATPVVFGEEAYILGAVTMEQLGLAPDPISKTEAYRSTNAGGGQTQHFYTA